MRAQVQRAPVRRKALVVLGMHRSGTSALTRVLNLAGSFLPAQLLPPVSGDNDKGFWEPVRLVEANEHALAAAGIPWHSPLRIDPAWFSSPQAGVITDELTRILDEEYAGQPLFVIKDPRLCRLLPLAGAALRRCDADPAYILMLRHPSAVAASLEKRNAIPRGHGMRLWLRYTLDSERETRNARRVFVDFEELVLDWRATLSRISVTLGVDLVTTGASESEIARFLDAQSIHHRGGDDTFLPDLVASAWSALCRMRSNSDSDQAGRDLDAIAEALNEADKWLEPQAKPNAEGRIGGAGVMTPSDPTTPSGRITRRCGWLAKLARRYAASGHFNAAHYLIRNPDVRGEPVWHYWLLGRVEGRSPHPLFEPRYYARAANIEHLPPGRWFRHFMEKGEPSGISPHPLIDLQRLARGYGVGNNLQGLFSRFANDPAPPCNPHPLFDVRYYLTRYPDVAADGINPLVHYLVYGAHEARQPSPYFDEAYYRQRLGKPLPEGAVALTHYVQTADGSNVSPTPRFDPAFFRACHPDAPGPYKDLLSRCLTMYDGHVPEEFMAWDGASYSLADIRVTPPERHARGAAMPEWLKRRLIEDVFRHPAFWTLRVPQIGFAVHPDEKGDFAAACGLARALRRRLPSRTVFLDPGQESGYDVNGLDAVIGLSADYEPDRLRNRSDHLIVIGWVRHSPDRWANRSSAGYDLLWASGSVVAAALAERLAQTVEIMPDLSDDSAGQECGRLVERHLQRLSTQLACA